MTADKGDKEAPKAGAKITIGERASEAPKAAAGGCC